MLSFVSYFSMQLPLLNPPEHILVIVGIVANLFVIIGMILYLPFATFRASWIFTLQGLLLVIFAIAVPYMNIGTISLLNKFSPADDQAKLQGLRSSAGRLAKVLGSIWTGSTLFSL